MVGKSRAEGAWRPGALAEQRRLGAGGGGRALPPLLPAAHPFRPSGLPKVLLDSRLFFPRGRFLDSRARKAPPPRSFQPGPRPFPAPSRPVGSRANRPAGFPRPKGPLGRPRLSAGRRLSGGEARAGRRGPGPISGLPPSLPRQPFLGEALGGLGRPGGSRRPPSSATSSGAVIWGAPAKAGLAGGRGGPRGLCSGRELPGLPAALLCPAGRLGGRGGEASRGSRPGAPASASSPSPAPAPPILSCAGPAPLAGEAPLGGACWSRGRGAGGAGGGRGGGGVGGGAVLATPPRPRFLSPAEPLIGFGGCHLAPGPGSASE